MKKIITLKKSDLIIPSSQPNIKVGSNVVFIDGSFTLSLIDGKMIHTFLGLTEDIYEVIAINIPLPSSMTSDVLHSSNNCIVYNKNNDTYHFCSSINIRSIKELGSKKPYILK